TCAKWAPLYRPFGPPMPREWTCLETLRKCADSSGRARALPAASGDQRLEICTRQSQARPKLLYRYRTQEFAVTVSPCRTAEECSASRLGWANPPRLPVS